MSHNPLDAARDEGFALGQSAQIETLRDRFAMAALQGLLANPTALKNTVRVFGFRGDDILAKQAYEFADAMLRARK